MEHKHDGVIVEYVFRTQRDLSQIQQVRFISNQLACEWLTETWPSIASRSHARLVHIYTNVPVYYPDPSIHFKDSPHIPEQSD